MNQKHDPKRKTDGSHPVATGIGSAGGAVAGAPIGTAIGGQNTPKFVNPTHQNAHRSEKKRP